MHKHPTKVESQAMDGYIRVSRVAGRAGDSFISPAVQREQIEGWAKLRGVTIAAWHEDLDQSGGKLSRPGLDALLRRIESGETGGVVVAKLDRLSRLGVGDALKLVERITTAGGTLAAIDLGLDPTTPFGEFGMTIMLAMGRMERRRFSDAWDTAKSRAMDRGVKIGPTPIGYLRAEGSTLELDPERGPVVTEAYRLAASDGLPAALEYLRARAPERHWTTFTARRLLATRTYLGESHYGDRVEHDAHPALTDRATWTAAQTEQGRRRAKASFPLSSIARCATCGERMVGGRQGAKKGVSRGVRTYRCAASLVRYKGTRCTLPATIVAEPLEELVRAALRKDFGSDRYGVPVQQADLDSAEQTMAAAERELEAFAGDLTARTALGDLYHPALRARADAVAAAQEAYRSEASRQAQVLSVDVATLLDTDDPAELRELFAATVDAVLVERGRGRVAERTRVVLQSDDRLAGVAAA